MDHELSIGILHPNVYERDRKASIAPSMPGNTSHDDMIHRTAQVMYEVSQYDGNHRIRLLGDTNTVPDLVLLVRQPDTFEPVRLAASVALGSAIDVYHVLLCPLDFEPPRVHEVYLDYEREERSHTKDAEGIRDTDPDRRRLRAARKEGRNPRNDEGTVTGEQPEAVTSQTSASHRRGGNTAKRTHSGSPEDA